MENVFIKEPTEYYRNLNVKGTAIDNLALYLSKSTGDTVAQCMVFLERELDVLTPVKIKGLSRLPNQDRVKDIVTIDKLLDNVDKGKSILSFNMVVYDNPNTNLSCTAEYVINKKAARKKIKHIGFQGEADGDLELSAFCSNSEAGIKLLINSLSGAHVSPHNPHFNKTAHSALTSLCRVATNYSNAGTERLITGNRHYWSAEIALANIISICKNTDLVEFEEFLIEYNLHIPTVDEVIKLVGRCTKFYWRDKVGTEDISTLIRTLSPVERAAFMYVGDLYHIGKYNRIFLTKLLDILLDTPPVTILDPDSIVKNAKPDTIALVGIFCSEMLAGGSVKSLRETNVDGYKKYADTIRHVEGTFLKYRTFVKNILITDNSPPTVFNFPSSIRRCVVGGDTDSTMFSVQTWIEWYFGDLVFTPKANKVANIFIFINAQVITHMLACMSKQLGVNDDKLFDFKMKNEFLFPVYMRANRAKHYATLITAREGNVYKVPKLEIKGVGLKDSKIPDKIIDGSHRLIEDSLSTILAGNKIKIHDVMQIIANNEHDILASIKAGKSDFLSYMTIKEEDAYTNPMSSNYMHYDLWVNVFADTLGAISPPPYRVIKLSTKLDTRNTTSKWIKSLPSDIQMKLLAWMELNEKERFGMILLPYELFEGSIPSMFIETIDERKLVAELMQSAYIYLEMCGFYFKNRYNTNMLSDSIIHRPLIKQETE